MDGTLVTADGIPTPSNVMVCIDQCGVDLWNETLLENRNISVNQPLMMYAREDIPPNLLIQDDPAIEGEVEVFLRINDLYVAVLLERDGSEGVNTADLTGLPSCLSTQTQSNIDCKILATCFDDYLMIIGEVGTP